VSSRGDTFEVFPEELRLMTEQFLLTAQKHKYHVAGFIFNRAEKPEDTVVINIGDYPYSADINLFKRLCSWYADAKKAGEVDFRKINPNVA